jgi:alkylated DNA repair dioxygenase AlkB
MKSKIPAPPRYEYVPNFLSPDKAEDLFERLKAIPGFKFETGSCELEPTHSTVQFGPRQAYLDCVPMIYRVKSCGEIPDFLAVLKDRLEEIHDCTFNSVQINQHYDHNSTVHAHHDSNPGHICMISVGAERDFCLHHQRPWHKEFARIKLANGSLLTFLPKEQWKMKHRMPRSEKPCGIRFSVIFRYIPFILTQTMPKNAASAKEKRRIAAERNAEYEVAQKDGRERRRVAKLDKDCAGNE